MFLIQPACLHLLTSFFLILLFHSFSSAFFSFLLLYLLLLLLLIFVLLSLLPFASHPSLSAPLHSALSPFFLLLFSLIPTFLLFSHAAWMSGNKSAVSYSPMRRMNLVVLKGLRSVGSGKGRTVSPKIVVHWQENGYLVETECAIVTTQWAIE